jgi:hypothetical protein
MDRSPLGCAIAQHLTAALLGVDTSNYESRATAVYAECSGIAREQKVGDWIEMPDGTVYTMTFKPKKGDSNA